MSCKDYELAIRMDNGDEYKLINHEDTDHTNIYLSVNGGDDDELYKNGYYHLGLFEEIAASLSTMLSA